MKKIRIISKLLEKSFCLVVFQEDFIEYITLATKPTIETMKGAIADGIPKVMEYKPVKPNNPTRTKITG